jgi:hypothetical protein
MADYVAYYRVSTNNADLNRLRRIGLLDLVAAGDNIGHRLRIRDNLQMNL